MESQNINFAAVPQTAVNVIAKPAEFFRSMPKTGGFLEPLIFVVMMGLIAGIIQAVMAFIGFGYAAVYEGGRTSGFAMILVVPIVAAVGSFIGAAVLFMIWKWMGSQEAYETAYRCVAYLMALAPITAVVNLIPYAGGVVSMALYVFYLVSASIHVHHIPSRKAWLVFGMIGVILALGNVFAENRVRQMKPELEKWRQAGDEYRKSAQDMQKSTGDMRRQAEEMSRQFQQQMEDAKRRAGQN